MNGTWNTELIQLEVENAWKTKQRKFHLTYKTRKETLPSTHVLMSDERV